MDFPLGSNLINYEFTGEIEMATDNYIDAFVTIAFSEVAIGP